MQVTLTTTVGSFTVACDEEGVATALRAALKHFRSARRQAMVHEYGPYDYGLGFVDAPRDLRTQRLASYASQAGTNAVNVATATG